MSLQHLCFQLKVNFIILHCLSRFQEAQDVFIKNIKEQKMPPYFFLIHGNNVQTQHKLDTSHIHYGIT